MGRAGDRAVVSASGELDAASAPELDAVLREQLAAGPVVLDLSELTFMDSSGVRTLDAILREGAERAWSLTVRPDIHRGARRVLELTGMIDALSFEEA